jgi:hypothetical protein
LGCLSSLNPINFPEILVSINFPEINIRRTINNRSPLPEHLVIVMDVLKLAIKVASIEGSVMG